MVIPSRSNRRHRNVTTEPSPVSAALRALEEAYKEADARKSEAFRRGMLPDSPTLVEHGPLQVLVSASPTPATMDSYIRTLTVHNVTHVVRVCEESYPATSLTDAGFEHHDWFFPDGDPPPFDVVDKWLDLLDRVIRLSDYGNSLTSAYFDDDRRSVESDAFTAPSPASSADLPPTLPVYPGSKSLPTALPMPRTTVAIHCAAGLGRAPALVAVALVELGLAPAEAVGWMRALRRGAINAQQCAFLYNYKRRPLPQAQPQSPLLLRSCKMSSSSSSSLSPGFSNKFCQGNTNRDSKELSNQDVQMQQQEQVQHQLQQQQMQRSRVRSALSVAALWPSRWGRSLRSRSPSVTHNSTPAEAQRPSQSFGRMR